MVQYHLTTAKHLQIKSTLISLSSNKKKKKKSNQPKKLRENTPKFIPMPINLSLFVSISLSLSLVSSLSSLSLTTLLGHGRSAGFSIRSCQVSHLSLSCSLLWIQSSLFIASLRSKSSTIFLWHVLRSFFFSSTNPFAFLEKKRGDREVWKKILDFGCCFCPSLRSSFLRSHLCWVVVLRGGEGEIWAALRWSLGGGDC